MNEAKYWTSFGRRGFSRRGLLKSGARGGAGLVAAVIGCAREKQPAGAPAAAEAKRGGVLAGNTTIGETPHLDPHLTATFTLHDTGAGVAYSRLFRLKLEKGVYPDSATPEGDLVERWEQPDPQTLIVHLFRGVKWHNIAPVNGRELRSQDVIFSFNRQAETKVNAAFVEPITKMTAVDNYTLRLDLAKPEADILLMLADMRCKIVAPEAMERRGDLKEAPVIGTGPWVFQEWQPNQVVRMTRNPDYFRSGLPYPDALVIFRITDPQTEQAAFKTRQIHVLDRAHKQIQDLVRRDVPGLTVLDNSLFGPAGGIRAYLHAQKAPTSDIRVRQAISKALDRDAFIRSIIFGSAFLSAGVFVPSMDWHLPDSERKRLLAQDLTEARHLLSAAGIDVASWRPETKNMRPPAEFGEAGELFAGQMKSFLNISVNLIPIDNIRMIEEVWRRGEFEIAVDGHIPQGVSTTMQLRAYWKTGGPLNGGRLSDALLDEWIEKQAVMVDDREGRKRLLQDIQRRVIELATVVNIYSRNEESVTWPFLRDYFNTSGTGEYARWEKAWLDV